MNGMETTNEPLAPLMSSVKMDWNTPDNALELIRAVAPIRLDPATDESNPTGALSIYTPKDNGLGEPWGGPGLVYCNPPYGRELAAWMDKMAHEGRSRTEIIGLVPARPDTRWWHNHALEATAICFWKGRLKFKGAPSAAPFPSAFLYWGGRPERFRAIFSPHGWVVQP